MKHTLKLFALTVLGLFVSLYANAQLTTSTLSGKVTDAQGVVPGAAIIATHTPSGTQYYAISNAEGRYTIQGMRPGRPYEVSVQLLGYKTVKCQDITLKLSETYSQNVVLEASTELLDEVVVSASATKFGAEKTGASTNVSNREMMNLPNSDRSIKALTKLSPYANGMSFAGSDGRSTNFTVDGANFNNNFGLSSSLPGGGTPISLDAIEEIQLVVAPFDVRQSNFVGGGINAVTKSGTNTFKGTAYAYYHDQDLRGNKIAGEDLGERAAEMVKTYGFTLGGPIIKNKLFFFANFEMNDQPGQAITTTGKTSKDDLQRVYDRLVNDYGYNPGSFTDFPGGITNMKFLGRIDWNISDAHKLALRYNKTKNTSWSAPSGNSCDDGMRNKAANRASNESQPFANNMYSQQNDVTSIAAELNSRFGDKISNQILATYSFINDQRGTNSDIFPHIDICQGYDAAGKFTNLPATSLGYELFTYLNGVTNKIFNVADNFTYYAGDHKITAGVNYEHMFADNSYIRNGTGYYRFASIDDFVNGNLPLTFCVQYNYDNAPATARINYDQYAAYVQDEWNVTDRFKLNYGVRFDTIIYDNDDLITNNAIKNYKMGDNFIDTGFWPKPTLQVNPRIGFNWDVNGDKSFVVRGGTGMFQGRLPLVFFTNMPTNGGMVQYQAALNAKNADMSQFAGGLVTDANGKASIAALQKKLFDMGYPSTITPEQGALPSSISAVDPDFKLPQAWKTSLAVDYTLPVSFPLTITAEGIFTKTINAATLSDWSVPEVGGFARFNGADNRPIYPDGYHTGLSAFMLENTSRGYGFQASLSVTAKPLPWLNLMAAYTHTMSKELTGMPGSNAESAFTYVPTVEGPNNIQLHNSQYVTPDRYIVSAGIHDKHCNHFTLILEGWRGGYLYSYMMANDMNGDGYNYDALYIPTDREVENGMFRFVSEDDKTRFMDYVHADDYLSNHQGEYAEAYSLYSPWVHKLDFDYKHDFKVRVGNYTHALQLSFDMKNVLNFFNSSWGVSKYLNPAIGSDARILKYEGADKDGYARFSTPASIDKNTETFVRNHSIGQCWNASIGIKYFFTGDKNEPGCGCKDAAPTFDNSALNDMIAKNKALEAENARLAAANKELSNRPAKVEKVVETKNVIVSDKAVVTFAQNSSELSAESKAILDQIKSGSSITVVGATSPEGTSARNSDLSIARANVVADYLRTRGVNVLSAEGNDAGRVAIVTIK